MVSDERKQEAEWDGHDDIESDLASEVAAAVKNVNKGSQVDGWILVVEDEAVEGMWESGEKGHEGEVNDEGQINIHNCIDEEDVFAFFGPFFAE